MYMFKGQNYAIYLQDYKCYKRKNLCREIQKNNSNYLGSGLKLVAAIKKYGKSNFVKIIIEECEKDEISSREKYWINFYNSTDNNIGYNISAGGEGGDHYWSTLSKEEKILHRQKISRSKIGKKHKPHSEETKLKMSKSFNRDPELLKKRAKLRCKTYTCVNHETREVFVTKNLSEFCQTYGLNKKALQHNARTKKISWKNWSCREGIFIEDKEILISKIEGEIEQALQKIKNALTRPKNGAKNGMFGKKHTEETKQKIKQKMCKSKNIEII